MSTHADPILNSTMRRHPEWHVKVYNPEGRGASGTSARGYLAEYEDALNEARAEAYDKGRLDEIHAQATGEYRTNPYKEESR